MYDYLGSYSFAKISAPPSPVGRQFATVSHGGVDGLSVWDLGKRGGPFTVRCLAYGANVSQARAYAREIVALEEADPVTLSVAGESEPDTVYQVLHVQTVLCRRIVYGRGPGGPFHAKLLLSVTLQPLVTD